ncbi:4-hydroxy-tetrahydrodipicolinate reductase [Ureibacillus xyleni]|uniref:4-hydroxy-tetrahydrodipicolinate reductase n=1 Tax=Ureibacillus xyleni TaxID=614648 RepID=A0A285T1Q4_9BACL|nr:dihydrodipicolinate reductase C-terminal domain-containing protein [Ureibacillus xyleni]SOC15198.1 4-hydroxy-tetrahydrodipicolinate reductase [Ureibacillus xyleni]
MIKIGLFGFGQTGSVVAGEIIRDSQCKLEWVIRQSPKNSSDYASLLLGFEHLEGKIVHIRDVNFDQFFKENQVDVIIDFSSSSSVSVYSSAVKYGCKIVSAISNYETKDINQLKQLSQEAAVLYSPNITVGINFLMEASKLLQKIAPHADIEIIEEHFRGKKDVSGTALRIAEQLGLDKSEHVNSIRVGGIVGKHEVVFGLPNQTIRIIHESHNRAAFGQGAIYAAKWIMGKEKGLYSMEQALSLMMNAPNDEIQSEPVAPL